MKSKPRVMTKEEVTTAFLRAVRGCITYWLKEAREPSTKGKLEGLAHSMLVIIDGGHGEMPAFVLAPLPAKEDKEFCRSEGRNWYPQNHDSNVKCDIAGELHSGVLNEKLYGE